MFGRKKEPKATQPSPRVIMIDRIADAVAQLGLGENHHRKLPGFCCPGFAAFPVCESNPSYRKVPKIDYEHRWQTCPEKSLLLSNPIS